MKTELLRHSGDREDVIARSFGAECRSPVKQVSKLPLGGLTTVADYDPQHTGQPVRTVITVAELLGRRPGSASTPDGGPLSTTATSVGALLGRPGYDSEEPA